MGNWRQEPVGEYALSPLSIGEPWCFLFLPPECRTAFVPRQP